MTVNKHEWTWINMNCRLVVQLCWTSTAERHVSLWPGQQLNITSHSHSQTYGTNLDCLRRAAVGLAQTCTIQSLVEQNKLWPSTVYARLHTHTHSTQCCYQGPAARGQGRELQWLTRKVKKVIFEDWHSKTRTKSLRTRTRSSKLVV